MEVTYDLLYQTILKAVSGLGFSETDEKIIAKAHADATRDGVESHGLNRVERFVDFVRKGYVDPKGQMTLVKSRGACELYEGQRAPGVLNAFKASRRAVELAQIHGIGLVALKNTTHWMRAATYAIDAVEKGFIFIAFTNVESIMPAWGQDKGTIGNNPMAIGIPYKDKPFILDMAMAQYSYGKAETLARKGEKMPYPGGFNSEGRLTDDPAEILKTGRFLPMGYWKGSGLAVGLDALASVLTGGLTGADMDQEGIGNCSGCSQVYLAIQADLFISKEEAERQCESIFENIKKGNRDVTYPGERMARHREKARITVDEGVFARVQALADQK